MKDIFKFDKDTVKGYLIYELRILSKIKKSFNYISDKLPNQELIDFNDINWLKGKNYHWCVIKNDNVTLIIRHYSTHFTIYSKVNKKEDIEDYFSEYGCFTFYTETNKLLNPNDSDDYCDDNFIDLNNFIGKIIDAIKDKKYRGLEYSLELPKHVELEYCFVGETIYSIDKIIYACEELFHLNMMLFAENDMIEQIKQFQVGDIFIKSTFGDSIINKVCTEVTDEYYHSVGIEIIDGKGRKEFKDVYSLTMYYYDNIFKK